MKGFINTVGYKDTLGQDRTKEIRGLVEIAGKTVVERTLEKFEEVGISQTLILTNPEHLEAYENFFANNRFNPKIWGYSKNPHPFFAYLSGVAMIGRYENILAVADDNIFDFSLSDIVEEFKETKQDYFAVGDFPKFLKKQNFELYNFGTCKIDKTGKAISVRNSFDNTNQYKHQKIIYDIYMTSKKTISKLITCFEKHGAEKAGKEWYKTFFTWEPKGFWADIGKPEMREYAEKYFSKKIS